METGHHHKILEKQQSKQHVRGNSFMTKSNNLIYSFIYALSYPYMPLTSTPFLTFKRIPKSLQVK